MEYVKAFTSGRAPRVLEDGSTREAIAAECRDAALAFMAGAGQGWDKRDLALWLAGPYAAATRRFPRGERVAGLSGAGAGGVDEAAVGELIARVRAELLALLVSVATPAGAVAFAEEAVARALVRDAIDADGRRVWVPTEAASMRLRARVESLFAADCLDDPSSYGELFVCKQCQAVVFDEHQKRLGICGAHRQQSGILTREGALVLFAAGDDL